MVYYAIIISSLQVLTPSQAAIACLVMLNLGPSYFDRLSNLALLKLTSAGADMTVCHNLEFHKELPYPLVWTRRKTVFSKLANCASNIYRTRRLWKQTLGTHLVDIRNNHQRGGMRNENKFLPFLPTLVGMQIKIRPEVV